MEINYFDAIIAITCILINNQIGYHVPKDRFILTFMEAWFSNIKLIKVLTLCNFFST